MGLLNHNLFAIDDVHTLEGLVNLYSLYVEDHIIALLNFRRYIFCFNFKSFLENSKRMTRSGYAAGHSLTQ